MVSMNRLYPSGSNSAGCQNQKPITGGTSRGSRIGAASPAHAGSDAKVLAKSTRRGTILRNGERSLRQAKLPQLGQMGIGWNLSGS